MFDLSRYQYKLPEELIAQYPCEPRDQSRLMIVDRASGNISEVKFRDLPNFLNEGDQLVFNNTKVIPARLMGKRPTGGAAEVFLTEQVDESSWIAMCRPARKLPVGSVVTFSDTFSCEVIEELPEGQRKVQFKSSGNFESELAKHGSMPLPHYMKRESEIGDEERYQTVYAENSGAIAAPTAGLHFTPELMKELEGKGVEQTFVTLHVGAGTFKPVFAEDIRDHKMHSERFHISQEAAKQLNERKRRIAVGTTSCRTLESIQGEYNEGAFETDIFIYPGYQFKQINSLLTNFHLPGSTLLMLVSAFGGYDLMMEAYNQAVRDEFRFFSYGDAMLIL